MKAARITTAIALVATLSAPFAALADPSIAEIRFNRAERSDPLLERTEQHGSPVTLTSIEAVRYGRSERSDLVEARSASQGSSPVAGNPSTNEHTLTSIEEIRYGRSERSDHN